MRLQRTPGAGDHAGNGGLTAGYLSHILANVAVVVDGSYRFLYRPILK